MQGLWSAHRRAKVNLNSLPAPSSNSTPLATPPQECAHAELPSTEPASMDGPQAQTTEMDESAVAAAVTVSATNSKRKSRTTRIADEGNKRPKLSSQSKDYAPPSTRPSDVGGADACIDTMRELVIMPLRHPEVYLHIGVQPTRGILLHGPPGCGKTLLANAIAGVSS